MSIPRASSPDIKEAFICVDVETAGPVPGDYSLLSIGACTMSEPPNTFYIELQPVNEELTAESARVHQLSMDRLKAEGLAPKEAMQRFAAWLEQQVGGGQAVFVAFNAAFDWMFVNYYFMHYLGRNPFGHAALDIKALYMGLAKVPWEKTSWRFIEPKFVASPALTHHALQDALDQARLFKRLMGEIGSGW